MDEDKKNLEELGELLKKYELQGSDKKFIQYLIKNNLHQKLYGWINTRIAGSIFTEIHRPK